MRSSTHVLEETKEPNCDQKAPPIKKFKKSASLILATIINNTKPNIKQIATTLNKPRTSEQLPPKTNTEEEPNELTKFLKSQMDFCKAISLPSVSEVTEVNKISLLECSHKPILILDLDETLIGCVQDEIMCRPHAIAMIDALKSVYDIWIWTASERPYAQFMIEWMGVSNSIRRLLCREDCVYVGGQYVKDIHRFVNIDEKRVIIVDNLVASFITELSNGIVVSSFDGNPEDIELRDLTYVLQSLAQEEDVRIKIKEFFNYSEYFQNITS